MNYYFKCFEKKIKLKLPFEANENLIFWLQRFCPNVEEIKNIDSCDMEIEFINSETYDYELNNNNLTIYGNLVNYESFMAKLITQCFQSKLIIDNILLVPAACVSNKNNCLLIIGDFWQGKTSVAINMSQKYNLNLLSDNYIAIRDGKVIGSTNYISVRKEDYNEKYTSFFNVNDRFFCKNEYLKENNELNIIGFLLPYINSSNDNIHFISEEESKWYLYQKFTRLLCGETILFNGKLPSPIFLDKTISKKIMDIVDGLLQENKIKYVSSNMDIITFEGYKQLNGGDE